MYIKMQVSIAGTEYSFHFGQVVDIEDELAGKWLDVGHAIEATKSEIKAVEKVKAQKAEDEKNEADRIAALNGGVNDADIGHDADGIPAVGNTAGSDASKPPDATGGGTINDGSGEAAPQT